MDTNILIGIAIGLLTGMIIGSVITIYIFLKNPIDYNKRECCHRLNLGDFVYNYISHNSRISLWELDPSDHHFSNLVWEGMSWQLPKELKSRQIKYIVDVTPELITLSAYSQLEAARAGEIHIELESEEK